MNMSSAIIIRSNFEFTIASLNILMLSFTPYNKKTKYKAKIQVGTAVPET